MRVLNGAGGRCWGRRTERDNTGIGMNILRRIWTELTERLRQRRGYGNTSEDDEGLPHSPCNSPTASDGLLVEKTAIKDLPTKSQSTCSDGSLLSMGSYEDDEAYEPNSRHSSKLSLHEKKPTTQDSDVEFDLRSTATPLNHSAAHHRVSLKPKRTHGAPKRKRSHPLSMALPVTPEVNEDSSVRSSSPEANKKESLIELYSVTSTKTLTETQLKCSSLPPGLSAPGVDSNRLNRSKSNAGSKSQDIFSKLPEDVIEKEEKLSLFDRIFPRKSGRKKKKEEREAKSEEVVVQSTEKETEISHQETVTDSVRSYTETSSIMRKTETSRPIPAPRSGAASRQRILPMDIVETQEETRNDSSILPKSSPEKTIIESTSPLQAELENRFKQRQISLSTSPTSPTAKLLESPTLPLSPRSPVALRHPKSLSPNLPTVISSKYDYSQISRSSASTKYTETKTKNEEIRHKLKMPGLSSLQQRVLTLSEDDPNKNFMSLTESQTETRPIRPISKSHSFKTVKQSFSPNRMGDDVKAKTEDFLSQEKEDSKITLTRAASLDSIKNLDDQMHLSEMNIELKKIPETITKTEEQIVEQITEPTITISGPSHTAVVNVTSNVENFTNISTNQTSEKVDGSTTISIKEQQVSVTKIQVKRETTQVTQSTVSIPKASVPEFLNKQLNKVEMKPSSNIILSMKSPKVIDDQNRPKNLFNFELESDITSKPPTPRKFSKENLEIIEKEETPYSSPKTPPVANVGSPRFKKREGSRKSSLISITPDSPNKEKSIFKSKSPSLSSLNDSDKSSQDSLDKLEEKSKDKDSPVSETVVLRRKSVGTKRKDDEPELMKVFARRSLKLKDSDIDALQETIQESKTRDSDKENQSDSPSDNRKKLFNKPTEVEMEKPKPLGKEVEEPIKEPSQEAKVVEKVQPGSSPVVLRRTLNNNVFVGQRAVTVNPTKTSEFIIKKQKSFSEHRKTDQWISNMKHEEVEFKEKIVQEDIISNISPSGDFIMEPKNFSQRKAEWEKRAQQAKKTTP